MRNLSSIYGQRFRQYRSQQENANLAFEWAKKAYEYGDYKNGAASRLASFYKSMEDYPKAISLYYE